MGYVLSGTVTERRAETALAALGTFNWYLLQNDRPSIQDDAGQPVSPPQLLAEVRRQASSDPDVGGELTATLVHYVEYTALRPWDDSPNFGRPPDFSWYVAGRGWVREFGEMPPASLLNELARRYERGRPSELLRGAEEELSRLSDLAALRRGSRGGRAQTLIQELIASLSADDVVHAIAESTRVSPAARSKAQALIGEWRRADRLNRAGDTQQAQPASQPARPPGRSRRP